MNVQLNEQNSKRLNVFFLDEQIDILVNDIIDNAILDFLVFIENIDNEKFKNYYKEMVKE